MCASLAACVGALLTSRHAAQERRALATLPRPAAPFQAEIADLQRQVADKRGELEALEAELREVGDRVAAAKDAGAHARGVCIAALPVLAFGAPAPAACAVGGCCTGRHGGTW